MNDEVLRDVKFFCQGESLLIVPPASFMVLKKSKSILRIFKYSSMFAGLNVSPAINRLIRDFPKSTTKGANVARMVMGSIT